MELEEYGQKIELGRGPIFEKCVLTSLARKIPKNVCHSAIHPRSSFCSRREILGTVFDLHDLGCCMFSSWIWALDVFPHFQKSTFGSLSNGWKFPKCEIHDFGLLCISSSGGQSFFIFWSLRISFLWCSCGWVLPQRFLLHFPNVYQDENHFCVAQRFWGETTSSWVLLMNSFLATLGPKRPWDTTCC